MVQLQTFTKSDFLLKNNCFDKNYFTKSVWVERYLDVVLEVLQVVGSKFQNVYKTCRYLTF